MRDGMTNGNQTIHWAVIVCGVVLAAVLVLALVRLLGNAGGYADAEKYTVGGTAIDAAKLANLDVHWTSGKIDVAYHKENTVTLTETANRELTDDMKLRWWLDGDTLRVQYAKPGLNLNWDLEKALTLTMPEGIALNSVSIQATSGDVGIPALRCGSLTVKVTSGDVTAAADAKEIAVNATSGDIRITAEGRPETVSIGTTSGNAGVEGEEAGSVTLSGTSGGLGAELNRVGTLKAGSTSGNIVVRLGEAESVSLNSTSGSVTADLTAFGALKAGTTSGNVNLTVPEDAGFTARLSVTGGEITYSLPLTRQDDKYVCGDGSASVEISATSGHIRIDGAQR